MCQKIKSLDCFNNHKREKFGKEYTCKECRKIRSKKYKEELKKDPVRYAHHKAVAKKNAATYLKKDSGLSIRYNNMKQRCTNSNFKQWADYGGRGISCEWINYEEFKKDMYQSYLDHLGKHGYFNSTLDRIDNDGNYSKANCRWATRKQQSANRRIYKK